MMIRAVPFFVALAAVFSLAVAHSSESYSQEAPSSQSLAALTSYAMTGTHFIDGDLIGNTRLFGPLRFAKFDVSLIPNTDYGIWFVKRIASNLNGDVAERVPYPPALRRFSRDVYTDQNGHFVFSQLPPGRYIAFAVVRRDDFETPDEIRTQTAIDSNGDYVNVPFRTRGLNIHAESDELVATLTVAQDRNGAHIDSFELLGATTCCKAHI